MAYTTRTGLGKSFLDDIISISDVVSKIGQSAQGVITAVNPPKTATVVTPVIVPGKPLIPGGKPPGTAPAIIPDVPAPVTGTTLAMDGVKKYAPYALIGLAALVLIKVLRR